MMIFPFLWMTIQTKKYRIYFSITIKASRRINYYLLFWIWRKNGLILRRCLGLSDFPSFYLHWISLVSCLLYLSSVFAQDFVEWVKVPIFQACSGEKKRHTQHFSFSSDKRKNGRRRKKEIEEWWAKRLLALQLLARMIIRLKARFLLQLNSSIFWKQSFYILITIFNREATFSSLSSSSSSTIKISSFTHHISFKLKLQKKKKLWTMMMTLTKEKYCKKLCFFCFAKDKCSKMTSHDTKGLPPHFF